VFVKFALFNLVIPKRSGQPGWDPDQERRPFLEMIEQQAWRQQQLASIPCPIVSSV
jgi:hypothetical protein